MDDPRTVEIFVTSKYPAAGKSSLACTIAFLLKEHGFNAILKEGGHPHFGVLGRLDDRPVMISEMLTGETPQREGKGLRFSAVPAQRSGANLTAGLGAFFIRLPLVAKNHTDRL